MRNWLPLFFAAALVAAPAQAQFLYLDVNTDGFCDAGDHVPNGQGQVDVWLDTTLDGNFNPVTCSTEGELTISGYQVILRSDTGTDVAWVNARTEFSVSLGFVWESRYIYVGYTSPGSATHLAPGRYKLGTLSVTSPERECPWIAIVPSHTFSVGTRLTEFSSQCLGVDGDYRQRLGVEFTDVCGTDANACDPIYPPLDSKSTTWGKIKELYRYK